MMAWYRAGVAPPRCGGLRWSGVDVGDSENHLAIRASKVDVGEVLWEASIVKEDSRLHNLLRQYACHAQHGPPPVLQLSLPVPAAAKALQVRCSAQGNAPTDAGCKSHYALHTDDGDT